MWWERFPHAVPPASGAAGSVCWTSHWLRYEFAHSSLWKQGTGLPIKANWDTKRACLSYTRLWATAQRCKFMLADAWSKSRVPDPGLCPSGTLFPCFSEECSCPYTSLILRKVLFIYFGGFKTVSPNFQVVHFKWVNVLWCFENPL